MDDQQKQKAQSGAFMPPTPRPVEMESLATPPPLPLNEMPFVPPLETRGMAPPPQAPSVFGAAPSQPPLTPEMRPKRKKRLIILVSIAGALALLAGGGALAYNLWYQNPEKVVTDGLMNALNAKTVSFTSVASVKGDTPTSVVLSGKLKGGTGSADVSVKATVGGQDYSLKGAAVLGDKGDLYVKAMDVNKLITPLENSDAVVLTEDMKQLIDDFVAKVNNQWIKINTDDVKTFSTSLAKGEKCLQDSTAKLQKDKAMSSELSGLYKKHKFITISKKLGSKNGSLGYEIEDNKDEAKLFAVGLKDTQFYKSLHDCDGDIVIDENSVANDSDTKSKVEVWVSRWAHQVTKVVISTDGGDNPSSTTTFEPTFNQPVTIPTPSPSKSVKELQQDIESFSTKFSQAFSSSAPPVDGSIEDGASSEEAADSDEDIDSDEDTDTTDNEWGDEDFDNDDMTMPSVDEDEQENLFS